MWLGSALSMADPSDDMWEREVRLSPISARVPGVGSSVRTVLFLFFLGMDMCCRTLAERQRFLLHSMPGGTRLARGRGRRLHEARTCRPTTAPRDNIDRSPAVLCRVSRVLPSLRAVCYGSPTGQVGFSGNW